MRQIILRTGLIAAQALGLVAVSAGGVKADTNKDIQDFIGLIKQTGTKVQKSEKCPGDTYGFYQQPQKDGTGDRIVFCTNNIDLEDTSAVWEVLAHEGAHVMQACNGGLLWKDEYHPRMLRNLKERAPHYAKILNQYRGRDKMYELEAFDMELKTAQKVKRYFLEFCKEEQQVPQTAEAQPAPSGNNSSVGSVLAVVGGEESFKTLMAWASENLTIQEQQQLMAILKSGDIEQIKKTLLSLQVRFNQDQSYQNYRLF